MRYFFIHFILVYISNYEVTKFNIPLNLRSVCLSVCMSVYLPLPSPMTATIITIDITITHATINIRIGIIYVRALYACRWFSTIRVVDNIRTYVRTLYALTHARRWFSAISSVDNISRT